MARLVLVAALLTGCAATVPMPGSEPAAGIKRWSAKASRPLSVMHRPRRPSLRPSRSHLRRSIAHNWTAVGMCESSGNPWTNTGNGYYGYLQEDLTFWTNYGGLRYAPRPDLASKLEQITVAERGLAVQGIGSWPVCGRYIRTAS